MFWMASDLVERTRAIAEQARDGLHDNKRNVIVRCPELAQFCRELNAALGGRVELVSAWDADGYAYGQPDTRRWVQVSDPPLRKGQRA